MILFSRVLKLKTKKSSRSRRQKRKAAGSGCDPGFRYGKILCKDCRKNGNQKKQANYILGKSYFDKKDYSEALMHFEIYSNIDNTETGAECAYLSAVCLYNTQRYDEAEEKVFFVSDKFSNYINWTARSFIILSDVYVAKDNIFQAKETLKSVIENYPDDEADYTEVIDMAQEKLNDIENTSNE